MPEPTHPAPPPPPPHRPNPSSTADKVLCERCGAEMFRMHAVWRCPSCGFKTDCCGWWRRRCPTSDADAQRGRPAGFALSASPSTDTQHWPL